jgi:type I restriction enzyme S subunit
LVDPLRPITYGIVQAGEDVPDGVPYIRPVDMFDENGVSAQSLRKTSPDIARAYARSAVIPGDLVVSIGPSFGKVMVVPADLNGANLTQGTARIAPSETIHARYLFWALRSLEAWEFWDSGCSGATFHALTLELLNETPIPLPPREAQRTIADFLDRKTAGIDALIARKERLLELLAERRRAILDSAVLGGLVANVSDLRLRLDGSGAVPRDWNVLPLRHLLHSIEQGWSPSCENRPAEDGEWGVLKVGCVNGGVFDPMENKALPADLAPMPEYEVRAGDILVSRANTRELLGSTALVGKAPSKLMLCDKLFRLHLRHDRVDARFLALSLRSSLARWQMEREATGSSSSMQNIGQDTLYRLTLPWPPLSEQRRIAAEVVRREAAVDGLSNAVRRQRDEARSYRQALITAAVTGRFDVVAVQEAA